MTKSTLRYRLENANTKCSECGSNEVDHYATGLNFCRNCGRVWEVKREKLQ